MLQTPKRKSERRRLDSNQIAGLLMIAGVVIGLAAIALERFDIIMVAVVIAVLIFMFSGARGGSTGAGGGDGGGGWGDGGCGGDGGGGGE